MIFGQEQLSFQLVRLEVFIAEMLRTQRIAEKVAKTSALLGDLCASALRTSHYLNRKKTF
jgi:hypothetical protein